MNKTSQLLIKERIKALRENTDFVDALLESLIGYAIIAADFDGNVIAYNEGAHQIYGYVPEEVIGKQNIDIFFPEDFVRQGKLEQAIKDLIRQGRFSCGGEKVKKNGERFPAQILFTLTKDKSGKMIGFIEIVADLTERRKTEKTKARVEQLERELRSLERISAPPATATTAEAFGLVSLRQASPETYNKLVQQYGDLIELALEQQAFKVEHDISGKLRTMADELGAFKASPRDVVEIHSTALKGKSGETSHTRAQAYAEEGRIMVLELMGHLVSYYRTYAPSRIIMKMDESPAKGG
jgi:PAS domain S-box-containing protein